VFRVPAKKEEVQGTETYRIAVYLPANYYVLLRGLAAKHKEPIASLAKRLLLPAIEEGASRSFKASNALFSAIARNEIPHELATELIGYFHANGELKEGGFPQAEISDEQE
jgi:hypothetical protein